VSFNVLRLWIAKNCVRISHYNSSAFSAQRTVLMLGDASTAQRFRVLTVPSATTGTRRVRHVRYNATRHTITPPTQLLCCPRRPVAFPAEVMAR
jgi:hypothetical protein